MNRIFKVIWSKSKNCFVVTSELAKNHTGKTKRVTSRKLVEKTMAVTMAVMGLTQMTLPMVSASFVTSVSNADANITISSTVDSTAGGKVYNVGLNSNVTAASLSTTQQAASNPLGSYNTESYLDGSGLQIKGVQNGVSNVTTLSDGSLRMTGSGYSTDSVTGEPLAPGYTNDANYTSAGMKTTETTADGRQNTFQASPGGINIYGSRHGGDVNHSDNSTQITATGLKIANSTGAKNEITNTGINVTSADGNTVTKMADTGLTATNSTTGDKTEINQTGISITNTINTSTSQVSLTGQGLNNGGNRITNVDTGVSKTDAVNVGQLNSNIDSVKNIISNVSNTVTNVSNTVQSNVSAIDSVSKVARAHTVVSNADANITIGSTVDSTTGAKVYNVGLNSNVTAASLSTTQSSLESTGII